MMSLQPAVSTLDGAGRGQEAGHLLAQGLMLGFGAGTFGGVLLALGGLAFARAADLPPSVLPGVAGFLHGGGVVDAGTRAAGRVPRPVRRVVDDPANHDLWRPRSCRYRPMRHGAGGWRQHPAAGIAERGGRPGRRPDHCHRLLAAGHRLSWLGAVLGPLSRGCLASQRMGARWARSRPPAPGRRPDRGHHRSRSLHVLVRDPHGRAVRGRRGCRASDRADGVRGHLHGAAWPLPGGDGAGRPCRGTGAIQPPFAVRGSPASLSWSPASA